MLRNTADSWGSGARFLHWAIALLVILEAPAGILMTRTFRASFKGGQSAALHQLVSQFHHTNGFLILALVVVRMLWRASDVVPASAARSPSWTRAPSVAVHAILYVLLLLIPLSGWAALSALADSAAYGRTHIWLFGWDGVVPRILAARPPQDPLGYALYGKWHIRLLWIGAGILALHVAAGLFHQVVLRDNTLRRMWTGRTRSPR